MCKNNKCVGNNEGFIRLVNDEYCIKCYQSLYYKTITKKKRKKRKSENPYSTWWLDAYNKT